MRFFFKAKDGGPESKVTGYWLFESKRFGSVVLLRFDEGSREAFHTHAFNAISWVFKGRLQEHVYGQSGTVIEYYPSLRYPIYTPRERFHRVFGMAKKTWVLSIRGPWFNIWHEYLPNSDLKLTLTHGRRTVG